MPRSTRCPVPPCSTAFRSGWKRPTAARRWLVKVRPDARTEFLLVGFAQRGSRHVRDRLDSGGHVNRSELATNLFSEFVGVDGAVGHDEGDDRLASAVVRHPEHGSLTYCGMAGQRVLDGPGEAVVPVDDDHFLGSATQVQVS